jgi:DNA repair protein RecO (recombination protein O)
MAADSSEAIVLRTYPFGEADLIVSYFTRDRGKLRGVAKRARRPKSPFGAGLQRLSYVRMFYFHRENRELDTLTSCEVVRSPFGATAAYDVSVVLDYITEVSELVLPPNEPNEKFFRLMLAVADHLAQTGEPGVWPAVNYFTLWCVRLGGFLGPLELSEEDRLLGEEILHSPIAGLSPRPWSRLTARAMRRQLLGLIEDHVERRLVTPQYLESIE